MHRADASLAQEVGPIFLGILVIDAVLEVKRQQILDLNRRENSDPHIRVNATKCQYTQSLEAFTDDLRCQRVVFVKHSLRLEVKGRRCITLLTLTSDCSCRTLEEILPEESLIRPSISKTLVGA